MRRGQVKPHVREDFVLRHTLTIGIHGSEFILRRDVTSVRSKAIPFHGFNEVLRHALAFQVHFRETILGEGYALICQRTKKFLGVRKIASAIPLLRACG